MIDHIQSWFLVVFMSLGLSQISAQVTIADALPGCLPIDIKEGVHCGSTNGTFDINASGQFEVNNVDGINCCMGGFGGGDGAAYFQFSTIDISNYTNIQISFDYSAYANDNKFEDDSPGAPILVCTGSNPPDNSHDQIIFLYSIDGGPFIQSLYVHGTSSADFTGTWMEGPLNGNTLTIRVIASNKAQSEYFYFQNLEVTATQVLSAGPDKEACPGQTVQLDGVGTGTWSGGVGVFSDPFSPTSTYTPDFSETNSNITLTYTGEPVFPGCVTPEDQVTVMVNPIEDASFTMSDFCAPTSGVPTIIGTQGGTFSFNPPPGDGAVINPTTGVITNAVGGNSYMVQYTTPGTCFDQQIITVNALLGPVGTLNGSAILCPGQCTTFSFSFTSGSEPYTINLSVSPPGFSLPAIPGVSASQTFTICYSGSFPLPTFDQSTFTITIPTLYSGSGSLILTGISDESGCPGSASGSFDLTLTSAPTANNAGPLTLCADPSGNATFNLTSLDNAISGGGGTLTVNWFEDAAGQIPISNPSAYVSSGGTVYAQVTNGSCDSDLIPIMLIVDIGDVPFLDMVCAESGLDACTVCLIGNTIDLGFLFGDNNSYNVLVVDNNTATQYTGIVSNFTNLTVNVSGSTTFSLLDIQPLSGCPNIDDYNDVVTITIVAGPDLDPITIPPTCESIVLPPITGSNLSGNPMYFTGPGGTGLPYNPGSVIFTSQILYLFDKNGDCSDEETVDITIIPLVIFDQISDVEGCGSVVLPAITGNGVSSDAVFNTDPLGLGTSYLPGSTVTTSLTLYVFDPAADPDCIGNSVFFSVVIHDIPPVPIISAVDCTGGNDNGSFEVLIPLGDYEYQVDSSSFQPSVNYTGIPNGSHIITVRDFNTQCKSSFQFNVNCNCSNPAIITLPKYTETICVHDTLNFNNITFSGSTTQVTISTNGQGILSPLSSTITPFNIQYIPDADDAGKVITITYTSNDPDGMDSCEPTVVTFNLNVLTMPKGSIQGPSVVCEQGALHLTAIGGISYNWSDNGGNSADANYTDITKPTIYYVTITDASGCNNILSHPVDITTSSAGRDTFAVFCNIVPDTVNLFNYLTPGTVMNGIWLSGKDTIKMPEKFIITNFSLGDTLLRYAIFDPICGSDTTNVLVTINPDNNAGNDYTREFCEGNTDIIDLYSFLGPHDKGGTWKVVPSGSIDITNPSFVTLSNVPSGKYLFSYIISGNNCLPDTAIVTLNITALPKAGDNVNISVCIGSEIDLLKLIKSGDLTGHFENINQHPGLNGQLWNTSGLSEGNYTFDYVVDGEGSCNKDIAQININLKSALSAGNNIQASFCSAKTINLFDFLDTSSDLGGTFSNQGQMVNNGIFATSDTEDTYTFVYEVGDGVTCPKSNATLVLNKIRKPVITNYVIDDICSGQCRDLIIQLNTGDESEIYLTGMDLLNNNKFSEVLITSGNNPLIVSICADGIPPFGLRKWPLNRQIVMTIDSLKLVNNGCVFDIDQPIIFNTLDLPVKSINPTICNNETFIINGETFSISRPKGEVLVPSVNPINCDTLLQVDLQFYNEAVGNYEASFCDDSKTVTIGDVTFSSASPDGVAILKGLSVNGCDSIVNVHISYDKIAFPGDFTMSTCDENFELVLGGQVFNKNNPEGQALVSGIAVGGCDSLINVKIIFDEFDFTYTLEYQCGNEPAIVQINTVTDVGPYTLMIDSKEAGQWNGLPFNITLEKGAHQMQLINDVGCSKTVNLMIDENEQEPNVMLTQSPLPDGSVQIIVTSTQNNIYNFEWIPFNTLNCRDCYNPIANPEVTTTYILNFLYGSDCSGSRSIKVERINADVVIPNIFSPNGDGFNDKFVVFLPDNVSGTIKNMSIYDRWGNLMYQAKNVSPNNPEFGWDGKFGAGIVSPGVYVYAIEVYFDSLGVTKRYSGSVTVVR